MGLSLVNEMEALTENILTSYETRKTFESDRKKMAQAETLERKCFVKDLSKNVHGMIENFQKEHEEMANNLKASLKNGEQERLKEFKNMIEVLRAHIKDNANYVAEKLKNFHESHADMSEQQKKELREYVKTLKTEVHNLFKNFHKSHADMSEQQKKELREYVKTLKTEVHNLLSGYRDEIDKAANAWKTMSDILAQKRGMFHSPCHSHETNTKNMDSTGSSGVYPQEIRDENDNKQVNLLHGRHLYENGNPLLTVDSSGVYPQEIWDENDNKPANLQEEPEVEADSDFTHTGKKKKRK